MHRTRILLLLAVGALLVAAPAASALVVQVHSPATILLTAPDGHGYFGCTNQSCTCPSTSPCTTTGTDFINSITPSSLCTKGLCTYSVAPGPDGLTTLNVPNIPGSWTVTYFGTESASPSGSPFSITTTYCKPLFYFPPWWVIPWYDSGSHCVGREVTVTLYSGTITPDESGTISFIQSQDGSVSPYSISETPDPTSGPGVLATATAMTTNHEVTQVTFEWHNPIDELEATCTVTKTGSSGTCTDASSTSCGFGCTEFTDSFTPEQAGTWTVYALFQDPHGTITTLEYTVDVSFIVTSEFPIGAVGAVAAPGLALLGYSRYRRSRITRPEEA